MSALGREQPCLRTAKSGHYVLVKEGALIEAIYAPEK
jgi:hypothetical protein